MKVPRKIEKLVEKFCAMNKSCTRISSEMDERTLKDAVSEYGKSIKSKPALAAMNMGRITKFVAAAAIFIAVVLGASLIDGPDVAGVVWGNVVTHIGDVDYVHMYYFKSRGNDFFRQFEGWHAHGKTVLCGDNGDATYDDGGISQRFNTHGMLTDRGPSVFPDGQTFLELFSIGLLSDKNQQFNEQTPARVGDDFLIYTFDPRPSESDWMEGIVITVGRNSLLPIQMKVCHKDGDYDLLIFDYEAPEKPAEFFELPMIGPANGAGEVMLDGEEVTIDITSAPDLKTAVVRLHSESVDAAGEVSFSLDVTFITEEGFRSGTNTAIRLRADEACRCGVGHAEGGLNGWPDDKYRNIRFSPWLRPTDTEDTYIVEIRCRVGTKTD